MDSSDLKTRWHRELRQFAWRRTPSRRAWDLSQAKVLRYLVNRYRQVPVTYVPKPAATSAATCELVTPQWKPRSSRELRTALDGIHRANVGSYAEFGLR